MRKIFLDLKKGPRHWYNEVVQARIGVREIALGYSVGIFVSMIALPILNILLLLIAISILKVNKLATMLGYITLLWPTTPFIYYLSLRLGLFIFGINAKIPNAGEISLDLIKKYALAFAFGNILLAASVATAFFLLIYSVGELLSFIKKKRQTLSPPENKAN